MTGNVLRVTGKSFPVARMSCRETGNDSRVTRQSFPVLWQSFPVL